MITIRRYVAASPEQVWDVLGDGWLYPLWVVGASRMRDVDEGWPAEGTRLHHSVGAWPVLVDDTTAVLSQEPGHRLVLDARAWPMGKARVELVLEPARGGTEVTIAEDVSKGPAKMLPKPVRAPMIRSRNVESLRRLAMLAEGRARRTP